MVMGANGKTGNRVAERLQKMNIPVRLGSRNGNPPFDWEKPGNWAEVLHGVQKVYITYQPDFVVPGSDEKIQLFVDTARETGVQKLVILSGRGEKEAQVCEDIVINSGLSWTIVRASWFMQNFSEFYFLPSILEGHLVNPEISALEPFVDVDDIAEVVVASLTDDAHNKKIYELTGPELLSFEAAVAIISASANRPVTYREVPMEEYKKSLREQQIPEDIIWLMEYLFSEVLDGRNESVTGDVKKVLGREPYSFSEYVTKARQTGVWEIQN